MNRSLAFIPVFLVGAMLMFLFDNVWTLLGGLTIQIIAVWMGVSAIAAPAFLEADAEEVDAAKRSASTSDAGGSEKTP